MAMARHCNISIKIPKAFWLHLSVWRKLWGGILQGILKLDHNTTM